MAFYHETKHFAPLYVHICHRYKIYIKSHVYFIFISKTKRCLRKYNINSKNLQSFQISNVNMHTRFGKEAFYAILSFMYAFSIYL